MFKIYLTLIVIGFFTLPAHAFPVTTCFPESAEGPVVGKYRLRGGTFLYENMGNIEVSELQSERNSVLARLIEHTNEVFGANSAVPYTDRPIVFRGTDLLPEGSNLGGDYFSNRASSDPLMQFRPEQLARNTADSGFVTASTSFWVPYLRYGTEIAFIDNTLLIEGAEGSKLTIDFESYLASENMPNYQREVAAPANIPNENIVGWVSKQHKLVNAPLPGMGSKVELGDTFNFIPNPEYSGTIGKDVIIEAMNTDSLLADTRLVEVNGIRPDVLEFPPDFN